MAELIWNINGKYFKDFGVYVSDSKGIMDEPNQKKTDTYDWAEYHGLATNLQSKPKYEAREFELSCWVKGADWLEMRNNFDGLMAEFRKAGKQRLTLDIFGEKTYVWDVNLVGKTELKKRFKTGRMFGAFTLKLIEYSPIKKILTTTKPNFQLSFNSPKWVEVNIDGAIESHKGVVNINKTLPNRSLTHYNFGGRNVVRDSNKFNAGGGATGITTQLTADGYLQVTTSAGNGDWHTNWAYNSGGIEENFIDGESFTITFWVRRLSGIGIPGIYIKSGMGYLPLNGNLNQTEFRPISYTGVWKKQNPISFHLGWVDTNGVFQISKWKIEKGNKATDWTPAPEDVRFISIAGNIDEITNLTTNAEVLWERL